VPPADNSTLSPTLHARHHAPRDLGTVVITGAASGLGAAIAAAVADAGATPVALDLNPPDADHDHELVDLADPNAARAAINRITDRHGAIDAVITAAGTDACGKLDDVDWHDWQRVIAVNLLGTAAVIHAALPTLRQRHGHIITVASTLGLKALPDATAYCASKFAVVGFTRALAAETAGQIAVTLLIPGGMQTHFFDNRPQQYKPAPDANLAPPQTIATAALHALHMPPGTELREITICPSTETSWP
jgi:NADP-dependent 3-hydroxy acid dehydrogenase YdfG